MLGVQEHLNCDGNFQESEILPLFRVVSYKFDASLQLECCSDMMTFNGER